MAEAPTTEPSPALPFAECDAVNAIRIRGARVHNLRNVDVDIPHGRLVALTGVSGSGKSSLAFDVLHAEGQRRYLEGFSSQSRQVAARIERPDVDSVDGLPPTLSVDQRAGAAWARSTVATITEAADYLRLLYARAGKAHCPQCGRPVSRQSPQQIVDRILSLEDRRRVMILAPLVRGRKGEHREVFESILKAGFVRVRVDGEIIDASEPPKLARSKPHTIEVVMDRIVVKDGIRPRLLESISAALQRGDGACVVSHEEANGWVDHLYSERFACADCGLSFAELEPRTFSFNSPYGACPECQGLGTVCTTHGQPDDDAPPCPACAGSRLNPFARAVTLDEVTLPELLEIPIAGSLAFLGALDQGGDSRPSDEAAVLKQTVPEICERLRFLVEVGLGYLSLDRRALTLSGGELQRSRLASCLGTGLTGVCYLLDEPTSGLHPRDTQRLLEALERLRHQGNSLLVVEHDLDVVRRADWVIDLGPGAGSEGGRIVAAGTPDAVAAAPHSLTGQFLESLESRTETLSSPRAVDEKTGQLVLAGASKHNLHDLTASIPLGRLVCVTGVSGSGKSTLITEILAPALRQALLGETPTGPFTSLSGFESLQRLVEIDQSPFGRSARSTPATYSGIWDEIRRLLARTKDARVRGFTARRFSLSEAEGRCPTCRGLGTQRLVMGFLPDLAVTCPTCRGARFNRATLAVRYGGRTAAEILALRIDEAREAFRDVPRAAAPLVTFCELGLGYLTLGQPALTLSGGEAQRVKLASELCRHETNHEPTLYLLDEPTTGLHPADVRRLLDVLQRLVDRGHSVLVIEHQLQVISQSDWVIDLGPDGGSAGGQILYAGPPEGLKDEPQSHTGAALRQSQL